MSRSVESETERVEGREEIRKARKKGGQTEDKRGSEWTRQGSPSLYDVGGEHKLLRDTLEVQGRNFSEGDSFGVHCGRWG